MLFGSMAGEPADIIRIVFDDAADISQRLVFACDIEATSCSNLVLEDYMHVGPI